MTALPYCLRHAADDRLPFYRSKRMDISYTDDARMVFARAGRAVIR